MEYSIIKESFYNGQIKQFKSQVKEFGLMEFAIMVKADDIAEETKVDMLSRYIILLDGEV